MKFLLQMALIFGIFWISQGAEDLLPFPFPASVIGLLTLLILLLLRVIKTSWIRETAEFLTGHMTFLLIPVCVSIMNYMDLILEHAVAFFVICLVSTVVTFAATAWTVQAACRVLERRRGEKE